MLTNHQLASYDAEVARLLAEGRVITVAGVADLAAMLEEIKSLCLKVEQLSETIAKLREDKLSIADDYLEFVTQHALN